MGSGRQDRSREGNRPAQVVADSLTAVELLLRAGRTAEIGPYLQSLDQTELPTQTRARLATAHGMALFELGDVIAACEQLQHAFELASDGPLDLQFSTALALFSRQSQFLAPDETLPTLSRLRQLGTRVGDAAAIANLHLVVARLEGFRGHCINARRHVHVARQLFGQSDRPAHRSIIDLVDSGLEMYAGNLNRAAQSARSGFEEANTAELCMPLAGSLTNLGFLSLLSGQADRARTCLEQALSLCNGLQLIRLSALDSLAQLALFLNDVAECSSVLERCREVLTQHRMPARSWSDFAHQLTRSAYFEHLHDWPAVIATVDAVDAEVARRQYKAIRTSLLCAKARALARLGRHAPAPRRLSPPPCACARAAPSIR